MRKSTDSKKNGKPQAQEGITRLNVKGFKWMVEKQEFEIRPLTILAGANSSGKSSMMQPLLLLKQTLDATYDPGPLLLNGPNVKFTSARQLLSRTGAGKQVSSFEVGIQQEARNGITIRFASRLGMRPKIAETVYREEAWSGIVREGMTLSEIKSTIPPPSLEPLKPLLDALGPRARWYVERNRCVLETFVEGPEEGSYSLPLLTVEGYLEDLIRETIHLPGLRGNPERTYPVSAVGEAFPGTFENYVGSVIAHWQANGDDQRLQTLSEHLEKLGLTWRVAAKRISDTEVELQAARLTHRPRQGSAEDMVSIADVGLGVSQVLPVLVALLVAKPGQLVYLEQPEIHLHPRAQWALAEPLAAAAVRGVRVVVETHSSLLLLGIQSLIAEGKILGPEKVKLHWFQRNRAGATEVRSADLDETGAFGDWPEDFADVSLRAESRYLDAAESRLAKRA